MARYDYSCHKCGTIEVMQGMNDKPLKKCPVCDSQVKRLISVCTGFILKGKGFHSNDYKRSNATIGTGEKASKGNVFFDDAFPEQGRIVEKLKKRRKGEQKLDGACCKEAGCALREAENKQFSKGD